MGTYTLIPEIYIGGFNKAEKVDLIERYIGNIPKKTSGSEEPGGPAVQSADVYNLEVLNIKEEQLLRLQEILADMQDLTMQTRASNQTQELQSADKERTRIAQYIVNRICNYKLLPLAAERNAALAMATEISPYIGIYRLPMGQKSAVINGLLTDARKSEYSAHVKTLNLEESLNQLEQMNNRYRELQTQRASQRDIKQERQTIKDLAAEAENLIDDMNALANATSLLEPCDEASAFIRETIKLFEEVKAARNKRGSRDDEDGGDDDDADDKPVEDDRPVVQ